MQFGVLQPVRHAFKDILPPSQEWRPPFKNNIPKEDGQALAQEMEAAHAARVAEAMFSGQRDPLSPLADAFQASRGAEGVFGRAIHGFYQDPS